MLRVPEYSLGWSFFEAFAFIQHQHPVGQIGYYSQVMRNENDTHTGFLLQFFQQQPHFQPSDYAQRSHVVDLLNQAAPLQPSVSIALDRQRDLQDMQQILAQLPARKPLDSEAPSAAQPVTQADDATVLAKRRALHEDVVSFYLHVLDQQHQQSALEYLLATELNWDPEIWLYQVIAEYQGLSSNEKQAFQLRYSQQKAGPFNDLQIIEDVQLQLLSQGLQV